MNPQVYAVQAWLHTVTTHNWPVILFGSATIYTALLAWRRPSRQRLAMLYGSVLSVLAYEYHKHIGPTLQEAADYLFMMELYWLNRPVWLLVGPVATTIVTLCALFFWWYALLAALGSSRVVANVLRKSDR